MRNVRRWLCLEAIIQLTLSWCFSRTTSRGGECASLIRRRIRFTTACIPVFRFRRRPEDFLKRFHRNTQRYKVRRGQKIVALQETPSSRDLYARRPPVLLFPRYNSLRCIGSLRLFGASGFERQWRMETYTVWQYCKSVLLPHCQWSAVTPTRTTSSSYDGTVQV